MPVAIPAHKPAKTANMSFFHARRTSGVRLNQPSDRWFQTCSNPVIFAGSMALPADVSPPRLQVRLGRRVIPCPVRAIPNRPAGEWEFHLEFATRLGLKIITLEQVDAGVGTPVARRILYVSLPAKHRISLALPGDDDALPCSMETSAAPLPEVRALAFYLPQFHRIPENDTWWGEGFTEWTNVRAAKPLFRSHDQPIAPHPDTGYYDLEDEAVLEKQAALAKAAGIHGFCFYYYWFGGKRLLERPLERLLASGRPVLPFCFCWANENWSRRWDGQDTEILIAQRHSPEDDEAVLRDLIRAFRDPRYIRVHGHPMLLIYRPALMPEAQATFVRWRELAQAEGIGGLHLVGVKGFGCDDPSAFGLDALVEFPPNDSGAMPLSHRPSGLDRGFDGKLYDYRDVRRRCLGSGARRSAPFYRGVTPCWDNTARRKLAGSIFLNSSPGAYLSWLRETVNLTRRTPDPEHRILFINAWNEWAEGCHLEPDTRHGYAWLNATRRALGSWPANTPLPRHLTLPDAPHVVLSALFFHREDLLPRWLDHFQPQAAEFCSGGHGTCALVLTLNYPVPSGLSHTLRERFSQGPQASGLTLHIHEPGYNQGFGAGHNATFSLHPCDVFVAVNSDLHVTRRDWLVSAVARLRETRAALVGPSASATRLREDGCGIPVSDTARDACDFVDASLLLVHAGAARELGLFSAGYPFAYFEDADLVLRYRQAGLDFAFIDLPIEHERSSSTLTLPRSAVEGLLDHNRARFFESWGGYLATRRLERTMAVVWSHTDRAQQIAALPALFGLLADHPSAHLLLAGIHPGLRPLFSHARISLIAPEAAAEPGAFARHYILDLIPPRQPEPWPHSIARTLGVNADEEAARSHLLSLSSHGQSDAVAAHPPCVLAVAEASPLLAGAQPSDETLSRVFTALREEGPAVSICDRPLYAQPAWPGEILTLGTLSPARLVSIIAGARAVVSGDHWLTSLAQVLQRPIFVWQGAATVQGAVWRWSEAGVFRAPGLDCIGCRAALGTAHENICLRGDLACVRPELAEPFIGQLRAFLARPQSPAWLEAAWSPPKLLARHRASPDAQLLARWPESLIGDVLVLVAHRPNASAEHLAHARRLAERATHGMKRTRIVFDSSGEAPPRGEHPSRQNALAAIRQGMIDRHLRDERWVFWADDDLVDYPENLVRELIRRSEGGIAAPIVLMEGEPEAQPRFKHGYGPGRFYDVAGFVEEGRWAGFTAPHFRQPGPVFDLESVGSCYLVPAEFYRQGARHEADPRTKAFLASGEAWPADATARGQRGEALAFTEHYSVCAFALAHGLPVRAFADLVVKHQRPA